MPRIYDIADKLRMPGLEIKATFYPSLLTTRLYKSARKMLASGCIMGSGGAAKVARHILKTRGVPYVVCNKWGVMTHGDFMLPESAREEVRDLHDAYLLVYSVQNPHFDEDDRKSSRKRLEEVMDGEHSWLSMYNTDTSEFRTRIADVFLANRTPREKQDAQQLLDLFDANDPMVMSLDY